MIKTYWRYTNYSNAPEEETPWELRYSEKTGYAAFARRRFKKGECIVVERPIVSVRGHHPFTEHQREEIAENVGKLDATDREAFFSMSNVFIEAVGGEEEGIFMTNSFDMVDSPQGPSCGMYLAIGRLNHSCCPNAQQTHIPDTGEEVLYASRDIESGDEINDCYIELRNSKSDRGKELLEYFRFECACESCCLEDNLSTADDKRRQRAMKLEDFTLQLAEMGEISHALSVSEELLNLLQRSENLCWSARYVPPAFFSAYQIADKMSEREKAISFLTSARNWYMDLQGPTSPDTVMSRSASG